MLLGVRHTKACAVAGDPKVAGSNMGSGRGIKGKVKKEPLTKVRSRNNSLDYGD